MPTSGLVTFNSDIVEYQKTTVNKGSDITPHYSLRSIIKFASCNIVIMMTAYLQSQTGKNFTDTLRSKILKFLASSELQQLCWTTVTCWTIPNWFQQNSRPSCSFFEENL